jgi:hypothetical protein
MQLAGTLAGCGDYPASAKGNGHETHDNRISRRACAHKHLGTGSNQRRRFGRRGLRGRFRHGWHHKRPVHERKPDRRHHRLGDPWHGDRSQQHHESVGQYACAQWLAEWIDVNADRTGLRSGQVIRQQVIRKVDRKKPRIARGFLISRLKPDVFGHKSASSLEENASNSNQNVKLLIPAGVRRRRQTPRRMLPGARHRHRPWSQAGRDRRGW